MLVSRLIGVAASLAAALLLAGCFSTSVPLLEAGDGDPFPGGAGTFRVLDEEGKPQGRLVLTALKGTGNRYRARSESSGSKPEEGELIVKAVAGDLYLVQFEEADDNYLISPAQITEEKFTIMVLDAETLSKIAEQHGVRTLQEPISGDRSEIERAQQAGERVLVQTLDGPVVHAPKETALAIAMDMAQSDQVVPLADGDYTRQAK